MRGFLIALLVNVYTRTSHVQAISVCISAWARNKPVASHTICYVCAFKAIKRRIQSLHGIVWALVFNSLVHTQYSTYIRNCAVSISAWDRIRRNCWFTYASRVDAKQ
jgi:hypothetical protein